MSRGSFEERNQWEKAWQGGWTLNLPKTIFTVSGKNLRTRPWQSTFALPWTDLEKAYKDLGGLGGPRSTLREVREGIS